MKGFKVVDRNRGSCVIQHVDYRLFYEKDTIVTALKETMGILFFDTEYNAKDFKKSNDFDGTMQIITIETIGDAKKLHYVGYTDRLDQFYKVVKDFFRDGITMQTPYAGYAPTGTYCSPAVKVLS